MTSPAGISSAVVLRTRTPDLYARIECSPVQDLVPTCLLKCLLSSRTAGEGPAPLLYAANITLVFAGSEDAEYLSR